MWAAFCIRHFLKLTLLDWLYSLLVMHHTAQNHNLRVVRAMNLHDMLAENAGAMGNTTADFRRAAQRHANATWLWLVAMAAVWYFIDWRWALIPAALAVYSIVKSVNSTMVVSRLEKIEQSRTQAVTDDVLAIIHAYGETLEFHTPAPGSVADARKLPYPKQVIKDALIAALRSSPDQQFREHLKIGYLQLSSWQDNVGDDDAGADFLSLDLTQDAKALAAQIVAGADHGEKWTNAARQETEELKHELQQLGL